MEISVSQQAAVFLLAVAFGFVLGALYDIFRIIRIAVKCGTVSVFLQDLLFFTICALLTFLYIFYTNSGDVRFFIILGEFFGAILYICSVGALVMRISAKIVEVIKRIVKFLCNIISKPFILFALFLKRHLSIFHKFLKKWLKIFFCYLKIKIFSYNKYIKQFFVKKKKNKDEVSVKTPIKESVRKRI